MIQQHYYIPTTGIVWLGADKKAELQDGRVIWVTSGVHTSKPIGLEEELILAIVALRAELQATKNLGSLHEPQQAAARDAQS